MDTNFRFFLVLLLSSQFLGAQGWKPAMQGLADEQNEQFFEIKFKSDGPMGRDWIFGNFLSEDSLTRCVAYREDGGWKPLPFSAYHGSSASDIEMYGDTLLIAGDFMDIVMDGSSDTVITNTALLKYHEDSIWTNMAHTYGIYDVAVRGDTILTSGGVYFHPPDTIQWQFMTTDDGRTWQYPYAVEHPTENPVDFGPITGVKILDNGDILTLNNGSSQGDPFRGLARWDGGQWHAYGSNGLRGPGYTMALDFDFFRDELYMAGSFANYYTYYGDTTNVVPENPGNNIVRWDGSRWHQLGTGVMEALVRDIFVYDDILYAQIDGGVSAYHRFGDAPIAYFAGWDGHQWCGTPLSYPPGIGPLSLGFAKDTLYAAFKYPSDTLSGDSITYINYFDGDYLGGPNSICSTHGLGKKEEEDFASAEIYPNPAEDFLQVILSEKAKLNLYDLTGHLVMSRILEAGENNVPLPAGLSGLYLVKVEASGAIHTAKVRIYNN